MASLSDRYQDCVEFQNPFFYTDNNGNIINPPEEKQSSLFGELAKSIATSVSLDKFEKSIEKTIKGFKGVLTNDVADIALKNTDELFNFGGPFLDFASQIIDGKEVDEALILAGIHFAVEALVMLLIPTLFPGLQMIGVATFIAIVVASAFNMFLDSCLEPVF